MGVFISDKSVSSLYFTLKSQEVWKVTSQHQIFALINIPWAITCEGGGLVHSGGNSCREKEEKGWRKSNPSSSGDQSVGVGSLEWILSEGQCSEHRELTTTAQRRWRRDGVLALREREGWIKLKAGILKSSSLCVHFFLKTWLLSKKHRTWLEWRRSPATGCWPPSDRPRP